MHSTQIRPLAPLDMSTRVRFLTKVQILSESECWPWTAMVGESGYGMMKLRAIEGGWDCFLATRIAYMLFYGADPGDQCVLHVCDNPRCCNPYHLFLGTWRDNNLDRAQKLRTHGTRLSPESISEAFGMRKLGKSSTEIAAALGVSRATINGVFAGRTWAWLKLAPAPTQHEIPL